MGNLLQKGLDLIEETIKPNLDVDWNKTMHNTE